MKMLKHFVPFFVLSLSVQTVFADAKLTTKGKAVSRDQFGTLQHGPEKNSTDECVIRASSGREMSDAIKCIARKTGKAVIAGREAKQLSWNQEDVDNLGDISFIKGKLEQQSLDWFESDGIVNILPRRNIDVLRREINKANSKHQCSDLGGTETVNSDFPEPTDIKDITKANSLWSGKTVILDKNVSGKVLIAHDIQVSKKFACKLWLRALSQVGLGASSRDNLFVLMPIRSFKTWEWPQTISSPSSSSKRSGLEFDFPEFVEIDQVTDRYNSITGENLKIDSQVKVGEIAIYNGAKIDSSQIKFVFETALRRSGLKVKNDKVTAL